MRRKEQRQRRLGTNLESLENRIVMDASLGFENAARLPESGIAIASPPTVYDPTCETSIDGNGVFTIEGGMAKDQIAVTNDSRQGVVKINVKCGSGVTAPWIFPQGELTRIVFYGGSGDDSFVNSTMIPSEAYGEGGNDTLIGGPAADELYGGAGVDFVKGNGSWVTSTMGDTLHGGGGDDKIVGGEGNDLIYGGGGNDNLQGNMGNDQLFGGTGLDVLYGQAGDDFLQGGYDNHSDILSGGSGKDTFVQQWREKVGNDRWAIKELETVIDYALGDTLDWKECSLPIVPWNPSL